MSYTSLECLERYELQRRFHSVQTTNEPPYENSIVNPQAPFQTILQKEPPFLPPITYTSPRLTSNDSFHLSPSSTIPLSSAIPRTSTFSSPFIPDIHKFTERLS